MENTEIEQEPRSVPIDQTVFYKNRRVILFMAKGKVEFREAYCKGCSLCVNACPKKILQISKRTNAKGYEVAECINMDECIGCASCATMCPDSVITVYRD